MDVHGGRISSIKEVNPSCDVDFFGFIDLNACRTLLKFIIALLKVIKKYFHVEKKARFMQRILARPGS